MTDVGMFEEVRLTDKIKELKKRIKELEGINNQHQKLNGELHKENKGLKEYIDKLSEERDNFEILLKNKAT